MELAKTELAHHPLQAPVPQRQHSCTHHSWPTGMPSHSLRQRVIPAPSPRVDHPPASTLGEGSIAYYHLHSS